MPKVGGKTFSYSKAGKAAAKKYAKRTGKKIVKSKKEKAIYFLLNALIIYSMCFIAYLLSLLIKIINAI